MITLFRKIRQRLVASGSVTKYLLYATGEILLVVVGILIALQVNNWNEERIESAQQFEMVSRLYAEFQSNYEELLFDITRLQDVIDALEYTISIMDSADEVTFSEEEIITTIVASATDPTWNPSSFVLADLKSNGQISSLKNEELVTLIFSWERFYENVIEYQINFVDANNDYVNHMTELGLIVNVSNRLGITNSESTASSTSIINRDDKFYNLAHRKLIQAHFLMLEYKNTADKLQEIIEVVN